MKFPKVIKYRKSEVTIYGKKANYPFYRIAYRTAGKRHLLNFAKYGDAVTEANKKARELSEGSQTAALTASQARDALAAYQRLETLRQATGRRVTLLAAVSEFAESSTKLDGKSINEAIDGYLNTVANVKRMDVAKAVEDFITLRQPLTEAKEGKRAQLSKNYNYMVGLWLRDFAKTFPATAICDLGKEHMNLFMDKYKTHSPKSRNHYRGAVRMFLTWCVKRDYLPVAHRLFDADRMATESADMAELDYFRPQELHDLLERASQEPEHEELDFRELVPIVTLGGLAGLRLEEILRLDWEDIWRIPGHIEIKAQKAKTRSRRLVEIGTALAAWLEQYREFSGAIFAKHRDTFHELFGSLRDSVKIPARRNGLRHAFCTYHFALNANENLTAQQAGNSPAMIHAHYKGLATKAEAEKWFNVLPPKSAKNVIPLVAKTR